MSASQELSGMQEGKAPGDGTEMGQQHAASKSRTRLSPGCYTKGGRNNRMKVQPVQVHLGSPTAASSAQSRVLSKAW